MATIKKESPSPKKAAAPEKKERTTIKYPPYVYGYGSVPKLFEGIKKASVPPKFNQDFMESVLEMKSSSHRALPGLLKRLGFIDNGNVPTDAYRDFRDESQSGSVMARQLRQGYADLYRANEYAHTLSREDLLKKLRSLTGAAGDDPNVAAVAGTFLELKKLADFTPSNEPPRSRPPAEGESTERDRGRPAAEVTRFGLSYTINLNLPATTEIEVFNAIFKSLREHLLDVA